MVIGNLVKLTVKMNHHRDNFKTCNCIDFIKACNNLLIVGMLNILPTICHTLIILYYLTTHLSVS